MEICTYLDPKIDKNKAMDFFHKVDLERGRETQAEQIYNEQREKLRNAVNEEMKARKLC